MVFDQGVAGQAGLGVSDLSSPREHPSISEGLLPHWGILAKLARPALLAIVIATTSISSTAVLAQRSSGKGGGKKHGQVKKGGKGASGQKSGGSKSGGSAGSSTGQGTNPSAGSPPTNESQAPAPKAPELMIDMSPEKLAQAGFKWFNEFPTRHIPYARTIGNPKLDRTTLLAICPVTLSGRTKEDDVLDAIISLRDEWNPRKHDYSTQVMGSALRYGVAGKDAATLFNIARVGYSTRTTDAYLSSEDLASGVIAAGKGSDPKGLSEAVGAIRDLADKYSKHKFDDTNTYPLQAASVMAAIEYKFHSSEADIKADMAYYLNNIGFKDRYDYLKTPQFSYLGQRIAALLAYAQRDSGLPKEKIAAMYRELFKLDGYPLSAADLVVSICGAAVVERDLKKPSPAVAPKPESRKSGPGGSESVISSIIGSGLRSAAASPIKRDVVRPNSRSLASYSGNAPRVQRRG